MSLTDSLQRASGLQYSTILYFGEVGSVCPVQVTALPCKCSSARIPDQSKTLKPFTFQSVALFFSVQPFYRSHLRLNHTFFFSKGPTLPQTYHCSTDVLYLSYVPLLFEDISRSDVILVCGPTCKFWPFNMNMSKISTGRHAGGQSDSVSPFK